MGILDYFTPEARRGNREWLDSQNAAISEALRYYLGPTGIPDRLGLLAESTPTAGLERAGAESSRMFEPGLSGAQRVEAFGNMISETAGAGAGLLGMPAAGRMADDLVEAAAPAVRQFNPTIPSSNMAVIRQDDIFRGHGAPKVSYDTATKPYAVRLTGLDQVEDMIASGLVRPKPGGYGKQGSSTLYFGEADTLDPTVFTKLSDSKGARLVADSTKIAGREGPISLNDLLHVFVLKDGKEVDILQDILRRNQKFGGTAVPTRAQAIGQQPQGLLGSGPQ